MMLCALLGSLNIPFYVERISFVRLSQLPLAARDLFFIFFLNSSFGLSVEIVLCALTAPTELKGACANTNHTASSEEVNCASLGGGLCQSSG